MITNEKIYTVSALNQEASHLLTSHFQVVCVTGEISNLSRPSSGHAYFSLKDENAQIRCALFRFQHLKTEFELENGQQIILYAQVALYEPRGDYQLIVKSVQLSGAGALQLAFEKLKNKLEKAGLFDEAHKKPLPQFPKTIGIITSATGAALQDILKVHHNRFPSIPLFLYPVSVQGDQAKFDIVNAIKQANDDKKSDVIIVARGGGSLEDLWAFNEEIVAQAIFNSHIPIVTGIGHQTDFTIADFVADMRAPTPSAAAEIVTPDGHALLREFIHFKDRLYHLIATKIKHCQAEILALTKQLKHPKEKLQLQAQQLDQLETQLKNALRHFLDFKKMQLQSASKTLDALSPLKVLTRGFSITKNKETNKVLASIYEVKSGDTIITQLTDGELLSTVL